MLSAVSCFSRTLQNNKKVVWDAFCSVKGINFSHSFNKVS